MKDGKLPSNIFSHALYLPTTYNTYSFSYIQHSLGGLNYLNLNRDRQSNMQTAIFQLAVKLWFMTASLFYIGLYVLLAIDIYPTYHRTHAFNQNEVIIRVKQAFESP